MTQVEIAGVDVPTGHLIGDERIGGGPGFAVHSPIDGAFLAEVPRGGADEVDAAVAAARDAFPTWARLGPEGRGVLLDRLAALILERVDEIAAVETHDNGSLIVGNRRNVIPRGARNISFFAEWARDRLGGEVIEGEATRDHVRYEPAGVAALIVPWNAPFMLGTWKVGPALAAGNTVVVKPPEWAPLTLSMLGDLALEVGIPPGVVNIVHGIGEEAGAALVRHPGVDRVSFTGSTETGSSIAEVAGRRLVPVSMELGGKSPFVVFADADLQAAARTVSRQFINAGQVCLAGTRVLVEASVADEFLEMVRAETGRLPVGDPRDEGTRIGPLITPEHRDRVDGFVGRALEQGAEVLLGGGRHPFGELYYQPTILGAVDQDFEIVQREVFGPVLTWQTFTDEDEAVALANGTEYGLAAMVYTRDEGRGMRVASAIVAGTVWVNCFFVRDLRAPFGGARRSGIGREGGTWSFDFYCDVKNVSVRRGSFEGGTS